MKMIQTGIETCFGMEILHSLEAMIIKNKTFLRLVPKTLFYTYLTVIVIENVNFKECKLYTVYR